MATTEQAEARARWLLITLLFAGTALNYVDRQVLAALASRRDDASALVREHVAWALSVR